MRSAVGLISQTIFLNTLGDILYFPFWWYSKGLVRFSKNFIRRLRNRAANLGVRIWVKNLFVPMFGVRDISGRLISFFMRLIQILARVIALAFWAVWEVAVYLLWVSAPIFVLGEIFYQFTALFNLS
ncbi:hypothetical protein HYT45_01400 [Candidatus Uhrbacteria bacterium]|nr:hypothetical protein [Candidatus Uhrbacteria bacterium]